MQFKILYNLILFNNFFICVISLDLNENSDEIEIIKHLFSKINRIVDGNDLVQKELSKITNRIQYLEESLSRTSKFFNNSVLSESTCSICDNLPSTSSFEQPPDNYKNWIVIQRRTDGSENFYRDWNDYKHGFGNRSHEFFAGLENIYQMTTKNPHEVVIVMEDYDNSKRYAKYDRFEIGSEAEGYVLKVLGSYSGNAGDSLTYHRGAKFSTKGRDNDEHENFNCAEKFGSGWWFKACFESNLNGCYNDANLWDPKRAVACGIHWKTLHGLWYSLKFVEIMIKRT